jgi:hypothetical protein
MLLISFPGVEEGVRMRASRGQRSGGNAEAPADAAGKETAQLKFSELEAAALMARCPRFNTCSAPSCPLDLKHDERMVLEGEDRCTLGKKKRMAIAAGTPLPRQGMTKPEWAGAQRWLNLPDSEKEALKQRGRAALLENRQGLKAATSSLTETPHRTGTV